MDGEVRGRGAQDMKDQVAAEVAAAAALGREGWRPRRGELLVVITADEEMGAAAGAQWLCREHPEKVRSDYVLNEGGGVSFELGGRRFYTLCVGEKGRAASRSAPGAPPATPRSRALGDNALLKLAPALERLREQPPLEPTPEGAGVPLGAQRRARSTAATRDALAAAVERLREAAPEVAAYLVEPMLRVTLVPTQAQRLREGERDPLARRGPGRLPGAARHGRGRGAASAPGRCWARLADGLELEFAEHVVGNRSPADSPLADDDRGLARARPTRAPPWSRS